MFSTVSVPSVVAEAVRVESTTLVPPVTVTVSATPPTFMATGSVTVCPTVSGTSSCTSVANAGILKVRR